MQVEVVRKQPGGDWNLFGIFARQLIQVMTSRIQFGHRMLGMERLYLVEHGLYKEIIEKDIDPETGRESTSRKYKPKNDTPEMMAAIAEAKAECYNMPSYQLMNKYFKQITAYEKEMRKDAVEMVKDYSVSKYCETVRGLGYIGALTFLSYFNPLRTKSPSHWMSMIGWTEGSKLRRGQQGHSNPLAKGRFYMCCNGVILQKDPYYYPLFKIKKEYLHQRPDFIFLKDVVKKKGVKAHIDLLGHDFIIKLISNHVFELMYLDYWGVDYYKSEEYSRVRHRNHIPRRDLVTEDEWQTIHEISKRVNDRIIVDAWKEWDKDPGTEWKKLLPNGSLNPHDKSQYREWLQHIPIEIYLQDEKIPGGRA